MVNLIAVIILIISLSGIIVILFRKIPALLEFSPELAIVQPSPFLKIKDKIIDYFKGFSFKKILQKILLRFKVLTLKTENKTSTWLERLRETEKKEDESSKGLGVSEGSEGPDNYWERLRKK